VGHTGGKRREWTRCVPSTTVRFPHSLENDFFHINTKHFPQVMSVGQKVCAEGTEERSLVRRDGPTFTASTPKFILHPSTPAPFLILPRPPALVYLHLPLHTLTKRSASPPLLESWLGLQKQQFREKGKELEWGTGTEGASLPRVLYTATVSFWSVSESRIKVLQTNSLNKNG